MHLCDGSKFFCDVAHLSVLICITQTLQAKFFPINVRGINTIICARKKINAELILHSLELIGGKWCGETFTFPSCYREANYGGRDWLSPLTNYDCRGWDVTVGISSEGNFCVGPKSLLPINK